MSRAAKFNTWTLVIACALVVLSGCTKPKQKPTCFAVANVQEALPETTVIDGRTAEKWLSVMKAAYQSASTYRETGVVENIFAGESKVRESGSFEVRFRRAGGFFFRHITGPDSPPPGHEYVIWASKTPSEAQSWWTVTREKSHDSVDMCTSTAFGVTGMSSGTSWNLLQNTAHLDTLRASQPRIAGSGEVGGHPCVRIVQTPPGVLKEELWIDQKTGVLRLLKVEFPKEAGTTILTFDPQIGATLTDADFLFTPPEK